MRKIQTVQTNQGQENRIAAFAYVFNARLIGKMAEIVEDDVASEIAAMAKEGAAPFALAFAHFRVTRAAKTVDQLLENLFALGFTLLRHHVVGILGSGARNKADRRDESCCA